MKKILALLMTVAMLLSVSAVIASAAPNVQWTAGKYAAGSADDFSTVGTIKIQWDPDASKKLDLTDGDMADWAAAGYNVTTIEPENMISWVGGTDNAVDEFMPEGWNISTYFVADSEWLYIGFYITDPEFVYAAHQNYGSGDAFQVCIDFGGKLGEAVENDPDSLTNLKNIFYSFGCEQDGARLEIMRQESDNDGWLSEENGDAWQGAARKTETGWSAEFALSFKMLYDDYVYKAWEDDPKIYVGGDEERPLKIGCALYYLNNDLNNDLKEDGTASGITWAAGTGSGYVLEDGHPGVSWTCYDNGIQLELDIEDDMTFACENIVVIPRSDTIPVETEAPETEAPETEAPTKAPETDAATEAATNAATNGSTEADTKPADEGCGSVIGAGAAVAVLAAAAAAVALKKKD